MVIITQKFEDRPERKYIEEIKRLKKIIRDQEALLDDAEQRIAFYKLKLAEREYPTTEKTAKVQPNITVEDFDLDSAFGGIFKDIFV